MAAPELSTWFVFVEGDVEDKAHYAGYRAEYDQEMGETIVTVHAPDKIAARNIAGHFGPVLDWIEVGEAAKA